MKTHDEVLEALQQKIPEEAIHPADQGAGIYGNYVTAQWAMQEANAVFGVDGVHDFELLSEQSIEIPIPGKSYGHWVFIATVKIWFQVLAAETGMARFSRIGRGVGIAQCPRGGTEPARPQQLDTAAKSALSDAIKNAIMRLGRHLGAELYFDERMAQVLGYEGASEQSERKERDTAEGKTELEVLGEIECKYGIGRPDEDGNKPYIGWTIAKMWDDPDGRGVFQWAVDKKAIGFLNEKLREYAALMEQAGDAAAERVTEEEGAGRDAGTTITIWTGESKVADECPSWDHIAGNDAFREMVAEAFDPDGKIKNFGPNHKRMKNHYRFHFKIDRPEHMTWAMLDALVQRCKHGQGQASVAYPLWYAPIPEVDSSQLDDPDAPSLDGPGPMMDIGPQRNQKIPASVQLAMNEAEIPEPNDWLWDRLMRGKAVGEWTEHHTDLVMKIIIAIGEGKVEYDSDTPGIMWEFGCNNITTH